MNHELSCLEAHSGATDQCHNQKIASLQAVVLQILKIVTRLFNYVTFLNRVTGVT